MKSENSDIINTKIEEYFPIGKKLNIVRLFVDDARCYPSYVKDIETNSILIDIPAKFGIRASIGIEDILEVTVINTDCAFTGESVVLSVQTGKVEGLWISVPEVLEKVQRRNYKRWQIVFPLKVLVLNNTKVVEEINGECFDISGSGIAVSSKYPIPHNKDIMVKLHYKDLDTTLKAKFIHARFDPIKKVYIAGLKFIDINRQITDKIHKFGVLFELELRRKGLL